MQIYPITDIENLAENLFENSEKIPNDIYINIMNMLKVYHESGNNETEINNYIKINKLNKLNIKIKYKYKCTCSCNIFIIFIIFICISVIACIFYLAITNKFSGDKHPPPP